MSAINPDVASRSKTSMRVEEERTTKAGPARKGSGAVRSGRNTSGADDELKVAPRSSPPRDGADDRVAARTAAAPETRPDEAVHRGETAAGAGETSGGAPDEDSGRRRIRQIQETLGAAGFQAVADGVMGPQTQDALRGFQSKSGLEPTGEPDDATLEALGLKPVASEAQEKQDRVTVRPQAISDEAVSDVSRDSLGFAPHVRALVRFLHAKETQPPLAIAVRAPWGRGKTSFMRMIRSQLERTSSSSVRFATSWFNPWKYNTREELWTAYLATVTSCIRDNLSIGDRIRFGLRRYWRGLGDRGSRTDFFLRLAMLSVTLALFSWVVLSPSMAVLATALVDGIFDPPIAEAIKASVGGALPWVGGILLVYYAYVHVLQKFNLDIIDYLRTAPAQQGIASLRQFEGELKLLAETKPDDLKAVVFIDDLDRCEPHILWEVMVAQQLAEVSSKCIFILAMDLDIVARTLGGMLAEHSQEPAQSEQQFGHGRGYRFLEKIVQSRVSIPAYGPAQIEAFVQRLVPEAGGPTQVDASRERRDAPSNGDDPPVVDDVSDDSPELREAILKYGCGYFDNPRRIKRFVNGLRLHVYLAQASNFPVDVDELARFIVLTERWPRLVDDLVRHPDWLGCALVPSEAEAMPPDVQNSSTLQSYWTEVRKVAADPDFRSLFGEDLVSPEPSATRLKDLCSWYGFRHYGEGGAPH